MVSLKLWAKKLKFYKKKKHFILLINDFTVSVIF